MSDDSEAEIVSKNHSKLLKAVEQLDKTQRVKKAERSEPTLQVSEFHLVKSAITNKDAVHVQDLAKSLGQKGYQSHLTKKLRYLQQKTKVLPKPLEKPAAERIKRTIGFENTKQNLQKWNAIIAKNRTAVQLSFPLKHTGEIKESPTTEFLKRFRLKSDLMTKLEEIDKEIGVKEKEEEKVEDPNKKFKVTMKELILKRKEAARQRALQSYREAKASRQCKIKSKKFHRIQRKEILKQQIKQFKELEATDAQAALEKLNQLDKVRAEERMSLRHRNTGNWAKNKQIQARYNKEVRQELAGQLALNKELTQKVRKDDSESEDEADELPANPSNDNDNPWTKTESDVDNFIKSYRQYWDKKHQKETEQAVAETKQQSNEKNTVDKSTSKKTTKAKREREEDKDEDVVETEHDSRFSRKDVANNSTSTKSTKTKRKRQEDKDKDKDVVEETDSRSFKKDKSTSKKTTKAKRTHQEDKDEDVVEIERDSRSFKKNTVDNSTSRKTTRAKRKRQEDKDEDVVETEHDSRSFKKESGKMKKMKKIKEKVTKSKSESNSSVVKSKTKKCKKPDPEEEEEEDYFPDLGFANAKQKVVFDEPLDETTGKDSARNDRNPTNMKITKDLEEELTKKAKKGAEIDPDKYLNVKPKYLHTPLPDMATGEEEENSEPDEEERHKIMSEAFADDDVVEEFRKEKEEAENKNTPQKLNLKLPGWGSWAGPAIEENKQPNKKKNNRRRKSKMIIMAVPKETPRREENKGDVIIFEHENEKLKKHLVSELPHPFTRVEDFEASLRAPISRTFVAENAHLQMIKPKVTTKLGQVIKPMDENALVKKQPIVKQRKRGFAAKNDKRNAIKKTKRRRMKSNQSAKKLNSHK